MFVIKYQNSILLIAILYCGQGIGQSCSKYGGGSCCPDLEPLKPGPEGSTGDPMYVTFLPKTDVSQTLDNICHTFFPVPDSPDTFLLYISWVYFDGRNEVFTFITSQPEVATGIRGHELQIRSALCGVKDTVFAKAECGSTTTFVAYRCPLFGECPEFISFKESVPIFGLSPDRRSLSRSCLNKIKSLINNKGLPDGEYITLPMKLPSRCVLNRVCSIEPASWRLRQAVGLAFPSFKID